MGEDLGELGWAFVSFGEKGFVYGFIIPCNGQGRGDVDRY